MKILGILTSDFSAYYELVEGLRERGIPFMSLVHGEDIPPNIGVVVTTTDEVARVRHPRVIPFTTVANTLDAAARALAGKDRYRRVTVGIDPGERPGIAVLGDGDVVATRQAQSPEAVGSLVAEILDGLTYDVARVRIGHGAPSMRDRIINQLMDLRLPMEEVNETATTPSAYKTSQERDITAAKAIALAGGTPLTKQRVVTPSDGEIRDIQRKSRLASRGAVTISRALARSVARGEITLDEAIGWQRNTAPGST